METKHDKHGGNAFLWGFVIGAFLATLLTTKRGRQILRELTDLGLELFEDFVEEKTQASNTKGSSEPDVQKNLEEVSEDLASEITEVETPPDKPKEANTPNGNGHQPKRRLFRGIRRK